MERSQRHTSDTIEITTYAWHTMPCFSRFIARLRECKWRNSHHAVMFFLLLSLISMLSFFRKLSIGGKIKDGILPEAVMGTAEDLLMVKNQTLKTDTDLKESVYGKFCALFVCCVARSFGYLSDIREMVRHCKWLIPYINENAQVTDITEIFLKMQILSIYIHSTMSLFFQIY